MYRFVCSIICDVDLKARFLYHIAPQLVGQSRMSGLFGEIGRRQFGDVLQIARQVAAWTLQQLPRQLLQAKTRGKVQQCRTLFRTWNKSEDQVDRSKFVISKIRNLLLLNLGFYFHHYREM